MVKKTFCIKKFNSFTFVEVVSWLRIQSIFANVSWALEKKMCVLLLGGVFHKSPNILLVDDSVVFSYILADFPSSFSFKYWVRGVEVSNHNCVFLLSVLYVFTSHILQFFCLAHTHLSSWWIDLLSFCNVPVSLW